MKRKCNLPSGFTLLELLLAVAILSVVTSITFFAFSAVTIAWRRGTAMTDSLSHGDYAIEQLVMGLRSAYFPDDRAESMSYGLWHEDNGSGSQSYDTLSWVKLGRSLVGSKCRFADSPHRVKFSLEPDENGEDAVAVRAWRIHGQLEDFEPDDLDPLFLAGRIEGFDCRCATNVEDGEIEWIDEWEQTNRLPDFIEITLYMAPVEDGREPIELKRIVEVPVATLGSAGIGMENVSHRGLHIR